MKVHREHRVPLSKQVIALLNSLPSREGLVFPGSKGKPLSDMTLTAVMRRMKVDAVPHGLRSSFRTWAADFTNHPREVCEQCLAHTTGSDVELAYQRSDLFEKRRQVMDEWASFVTSRAPE
jgi:integrase